MLDVGIVTTGHDVADARLHRICAALRRRGLTVGVLGLGEAKGAPKDVATQTAPRRGPVVRAVRALLWPWRLRARVLVSLDPDSALGVAVRTRLDPRRPRFVSDVHEDYAALLRDRSWAHGWLRVGAAAAARSGQWVSTTAHLTVVADDHLLPAAPRRLVVRNLPDLSAVPEPGPRDTTPRAVYIGDIRRSRGLRTMVEAVRDAPGWHLDLVGPINSSDDRAWLEHVLDEGLGDRVRWHGRQPPAQAWTIARGAWVGLLLLDDTPAFRDALPTKLYEYLAAGLAVVATPLPRVREMLERTRTGVLVNTPGAAAQQLRAWEREPALIETVRAAAADLRSGGELRSSELDELAAGVAVLARG